MRAGARVAIVFAVTSCAVPLSFWRVEATASTLPLRFRAVEEEEEEEAEAAAAGRALELDDGTELPPPTLVLLDASSESDDVMEVTRVQREAHVEGLLCHISPAHFARYAIA